MKQDGSGKREEDDRKSGHIWQPSVAHSFVVERLDGFPGNVQHQRVISV